MNRILLTAAVGGIAFAASAAQADTLAYLNFENGTAGQPVFGSTNPTNGVNDASGNGNFYYAFQADGSASFSALVPYAATPQTGAANTLSLATPADLFSGNGSDAAPNSPINGYNFSNGFTIEVTAQANALGQFGGIFGKDGMPTASPLAPVQLKLRGDDNTFQIEVVDTAGVGHDVRTTFSPTVGTFYSLAATYDGTNLSLYSKVAGSADDYALQGTTTTADIASGFDSTTTIGRGFFNGGIADFFNGNVDDVRVSDVALDPSQFLGVSAAIPEPASLGLLGLGGLALLRRRR